LSVDFFSDQNPIIIVSNIEMQRQRKEKLKDSVLCKYNNWMNNKRELKKREILGSWWYNEKSVASNLISIIITSKINCRLPSRTNDEIQQRLNDK